MGLYFNIYIILSEGTTRPEWEQPFLGFNLLSFFHEILLLSFQNT
jgi:hypothetical protein